MIDKKPTDNAEYFKYLSSLIKNDEQHEHEIQLRILMVKAAFNKKNTLSPANFLKLKEETNKILHLEHSSV